MQRQGEPRPPAVGSHDYAGDALQALGPAPTARRRLIGAVVFALSSTGFLLLRTNDFLLVDGALRCLEVFYRDEVFLHANSHLLYPVYVFGWHRLLLSFPNVSADSALEYLRLTQLQVSLIAGICVSLVFRFMELLTGSVRTGLLASLVLATSHAFLAHATSSAEPLFGLAWSLLALNTLIGEEGTLFRPLVAGSLMAMATASYQSMALVGPSLALLCWLLPKTSRSQRLMRCGALAAGFLATVLCVFWLAFEFEGLFTPAEKLERFTTVPNSHAYGGGSLRNGLLLPLGFAANLTAAVPRGFPGIRSLLRDTAATSITATIVLAVLFLTIAMGVSLRRSWSSFDDRRRAWIVALAVGLLSALAAPLFWEPLYDKLWLQPLAWFSLLAGVALGSSRAPNLRRVAAAVLIPLAASSLAGAVADHNRPTPFLAEAQRVANIVGPADLVVHDWDPISVLYGTFWGWAPNRHRFDFPTAAVEMGAAAAPALDRAVNEALRRGDRVFFIGVVDASQQQWRVFLGDRAGVPYAALHRYRSGLREVLSFEHAGRRTSLFEWQATASDYPPGPPAR